MTTFGFCAHLRFVKGNPDARAIPQIADADTRHFALLAFQLARDRVPLGKPLSALNAL
ncbi:MAG: hypothetical protein OXC63_14730 [Aestuariivita sp.]|nr:hypothetical protein [Aestuariivita sp.]